MADSGDFADDVLNLIGYGLAKFDMAFVAAFGYRRKVDFYHFLIAQGVAKTMPAIRGRRDLLDPFFDNGRRGWVGKGRQYLHRKLYLDSLFGELDAVQYARVVWALLARGKAEGGEVPGVSPMVCSRFRQLQLTGREAEFYFMRNFREVPAFARGELADARFLGDGYDFEVREEGRYFLAEVKGVRGEAGGVRMTAREYARAAEVGQDYGLVVVSRLAGAPRMTAVFDPIRVLRLERCESVRTMVSYHSEALSW